MHECSVPLWAVMRGQTLEFYTENYVGINIEYGAKVGLLFLARGYLLPKLPYYLRIYAMVCFGRL